MACKLTAETVMEAVHKTMEGPFVRGVSDCCTAACQAFGEVWGEDPLGPVEYRTAIGAARFLLPYGGIDGCAKAIAARAGLVLGDAAPGALGVIRHQAAATSDPELSRGWVMGICVDGRTWAIKGEHGFILAEFDLQGWRPKWA
ncbi:hypothetical protein GCM10007385_35580 [Tateyamaria omphalii]|uniref:DUF6950 family protein n=1 Tax=Tateyamaria omphalii TaxID=299262 RepID=UPI00167C0185|nr:hypothetical protein [Tateyamaria omphalii]GGX63330.1 hypothetical protein GCM10007385_35580 [Tateyamaria omphalii]